MKEKKNYEEILFYQVHTDCLLDAVGYSNVMSLMYWKATVKFSLMKNSKNYQTVSFISFLLIMIFILCYNIIFM